MRRESRQALSIDRVSNIHGEEAAGLFVTRAVQMRAPHVDLLALSRLDERLTAHLDGIIVSGAFAERYCQAALDRPRRGTAFAATVWAIEEEQWSWLERLWSMARPRAAVRNAIISAFGWVGASRLQGVAQNLLTSADVWARATGIAVCALHRVDPGLSTRGLIEDASPVVRAYALRAAGTLGILSCASACAAALADSDPGCRFWGAWSAVLLGNRHAALDTLADAAADVGWHERARAFRLVLQTLDPPSARAVLQELSADDSQWRWVIHGAGVAGDPVYVPWLIEQMADPERARVAGEAFTLITGADLDGLQLYRPQPETAQLGPTNDPKDADVSLDPDDGLMWADQDKVHRWWTANAERFSAGHRHFLGARIATEHCGRVLAKGFQRQRILAAHHLALLAPGTPLFNTTAPAWRQRRALPYA